MRAETETAAEYRVDTGTSEDDIISRAMRINGGWKMIKTVILTAAYAFALAVLVVTW